MERAETFGGTLGITLQGPRGLRKGTFGSHYRTKGQGAGKQSKSGSEVPDCPPGAEVNSIRTSPLTGSLLKLSPTTTPANNNILPGAQLVKACIRAEQWCGGNGVFPGARLTAVGSQSC